MYLELKHPRPLAELNDAGSLSRTAERLHLIQSALSHQIRTLQQYFSLADLDAFFRRRSRLLCGR